MPISTIDKLKNCILKLKIFLIIFCWFDMPKSTYLLKMTFNNISYLFKTLLKLNDKTIGQLPDSA